MESRREEAYNFSYCLFGYIYKDIHKRTPLPVIVDYAVPSTKLFESEIGDCVLSICQVHETFLNPVFSKIFPSICTTETYFFEYVRWYYDKVAGAFNDEYHNLYIKNYQENFTGPFFVKFLTLCSFIAELVRYCFGRKCYSFTSSAPTSLAEIILNLPDIVQYFSSSTNTFKCLKQFCITVINDTAIYTSIFCDIFKLQSDILQENCSLSQLMNYLPSDLLTFPAFSKISSKVVAAESRKENLEIMSREELQSLEPTLFQHIQSNKRKYDALNVRDDVELRPDSPVYFDPGDRCDASIYLSHSDRRCKVSNVVRSLDSETSDDSGNSKFPIEKGCLHCGKLCLKYLEIFVNDFKITNYEDEDL